MNQLLVDAIGKFSEKIGLLRRVFTAGLLWMLLYAPALASSNVQMLYTNEPETQGYQLGDFDGDGVTDLFRIVGAQWQFSPGGVGAWRDLASDSTPLSDLRFGDFNGDGVTDVFRAIASGGTNQWQVSYGGRTAWTNLVGDPRPLSELRFGDFNGDGRTDVFSVNAGGQWIYSPGGVESWRNLAIEPATPLHDLRFGDFDGDGRTDVFRAVWTGATFQWQYSSGGIGAWMNLAGDPTPIADLRFADFDGDGFTDVFRKTGNQWQYSPGARLAWVNLAEDSTPLADLRFGDFDGDGISDVFSVAGGQPRYSSGGVRAWTSLVAGSRDIYELRFGDFNNDSVTDVFRAVWTGTTYQWQYSPGGIGAWENLATDPTPIELLRFGDFNGDGFTDVFRVIPSGGTNQWQYSPRARDPWQNLGSDLALLTELRFGDFNGDGRTDVFSVVRQIDGGGNFTTYQWRYSPGATGAWQNLATDPTPLANLRFGHFDANATTDVFSQQRIGATYNDATYQWRYSPDSLGAWQALTTDPLNLTGLRFADLDGNGITDVFRTLRQATTYQWQVSRDARNPWQNLASDPTPPSELRFGDFNGDGRADVFGIGSDGRWRYSSGGESPWILLGPPTDAPPTSTSTPVPTSTPPTSTPPTSTPPTYTPTATPVPSVTPVAPVTPAPSCPNILSNSSFEQNSAWIFGNSPVPARYTSAQTRSGHRAVLLGNPPDLGFADQVSYSSIRQSVTIPRHATSVQLRFWHYSHSQAGNNPSPTSTQDRQEVILLTPQGNTLRILSRILRNDNSWQQSVIDLSEFAGQSFHVYFNVYNDGDGARTWMYLDDVELLVCGHAAPPGYQPPGYQPPAYKPPAYHPPAYHPPVYQPPAYYPPYKGPPPSYRPPPGYKPKPYQRPPVQPPPGTHPYPPSTPDPTATPEPEIETGFVVTVVTGDTIVVRIGGVDYTIRYLGIDAPELNEPFGEEATGLNNFLVAGTVVYLERDTSDTDRFGRRLRYVFLDDGTFVNLELVRMGLARAMGAAPDTRYLADLLQAEIEAREAQVGMWANGASGMNGAENDLGLLAPENGVAAQALSLPDTMSATPAPGDEDKGGPPDGFVPADPHAALEADSAWDSVEADVASARIDAPQADDAPRADVVVGPLAAPEDVRFVEPDQCIELVNNGGFEIPDTGWNFLSGAIFPAYTSDRVFNESRYALQLGLPEGENRSGISAIDQLVYLPESADSIVLSFRYLPLIRGSAGPGDLQYVDVYNGVTGQFAGRVLGEQRNSETWLSVNYDLTHLTGQPVRLVFAVNNDGVAGTIAMVVDQVSIWACNMSHLATPEGGNNDGLASPGQATPTPTPEDAPPSSSLSRDGTLSGNQPSWIDRIGTILTMSAIFGAIALITIVAVGVRQAKRS